MMASKNRGTSHQDCQRHSRQPAPPCRRQKPSCPGEWCIQCTTPASENRTAHRKRLLRHSTWIFFTTTTLSSKNHHCDCGHTWPCSGREARQQHAQPRHDANKKCGM